MTLDHRPRIYLHPDQRFISIGFNDTQDTLLAMPDPVEGWGDHARAVEWVEAVAAALNRQQSA